jgi:hypothetical protein
MSAKREETRERRMAALVDACARGTSVPPLRALEKVGSRKAGGRP